MGSALSHDANHLSPKKIILISLAGGFTGGLAFWTLSYFFSGKETSKTLSSMSSLIKETLQRKDGELKERSKKAKDELTACTEDLTPLKELKSGIERLISEYKSQLAKKEKERENNEDMVKDVEVKIEESERKNTTDITERCLQEQQRLLEAQDELEKRKKELEEKKLETEKLLQKADKVDKAMTERLGRVKTTIDAIIFLVGGAKSEDEDHLCTESEPSSNHDDLDDIPECFFFYIG